MQKKSFFKVFLQVYFPLVSSFQLNYLACSIVKLLSEEYSCNIKCFKQVSTSAVTEEKEELPVVSDGESTKLNILESDDERVIAVHYVLEESSGYMEPTLRILAILHTVISFFCIIGYYCLKVRKKIYSFFLGLNFFIYLEV